MVPKQRPGKEAVTSAAAASPLPMVERHIAGKDFSL